MRERWAARIPDRFALILPAGGWLSLAYLLVLAATILLQPFSPMNPIELFTASNYWLTPIQGLVVAAIGVLYDQRKAGRRGRRTAGHKSFNRIAVFRLVPRAPALSASSGRDPAMINWAFILCSWCELLMNGLRGAT